MYCMRGKVSVEYVHGLPAVYMARQVSLQTPKPYGTGRSQYSVHHKAVAYRTAVAAAPRDTLLSTASH